MRKNTLAASVCLLIAANFLCYECVARDSSWVARSGQLAYRTAPTQLTVTKSTNAKSTNTGSSSSEKAKITELNQAIRNDPKNPAYFWRRANLYNLSGDYHRALSDYTDAIRLEPMNAQFYLGRAHLYADHGEKVLADADEKQARFVDPKIAVTSQPAHARQRMPRRGRRGLNGVIRAVNSN